MFNHLLSLLIWLPIIGAVPVLLAGSTRPMLARSLALLITVVTFIASLWLLRYDPNGSVMQLAETHVWIATWGVHFTLAVDGISVALVLMTTFVGILVIAGAWKVIQTRTHQYMACMLVLEGLLIGVFCATDALVFYAFFEAVLIPMYILIGMWGGQRRVYATLKLFIYTFTGSVFMLIALLYLYQKAHTFDLATLAALPLTMKEQTWLFFGFLLAFAIKVPMVPVHTWLPDAHVEAPTGGSVWLAAVMLKIGTYGMLRFILPITPDAGAHFAWLVIVLSLVAIVYIGYVALVQTDMKKLVAYSSVAHMGFVTLGIFMAFMLVRDSGNIEMASLGMQGAMIQMISHGFVSGAMFTCIGIMYDRTHTRQISDYGGVINMMPWFGFFYVLFAMARVCRRVHGDSGQLQCEPVDCHLLRVHADHRRRLHLVAGQTRAVGRGYYRTRQTDDSAHPARDLGAHRLRRRGSGYRCVAAAAGPPHGQLSGAPGAATRRPQDLSRSEHAHS